MDIDLIQAVFIPVVYSITVMNPITRQSNETGATLLFLSFLSQSLRGFIARMD